MSADFDIDMSSVDKLVPKKKKKKNQPREESIQIRVVRYLAEAYPEVLFRADVAAGSFQSIGMAMKMKRLGGNSASWPDMFIAHPAKGYHGLFLELKREGATIFKKNGELVANEHVREQAATLEKLRGRGYAAEFAVGFEAAKKQIDDYLENENFS